MSYSVFDWFVLTIHALSEQLAHSAVDLHLKEISEFLHGSEMNKNPTLPWPLQIAECASYVQLNVWHRPPTVMIKAPMAHSVWTVYQLLNQLSPHPSEMI